MSRKKRKNLLSKARAQFRSYRNENPEEFEDAPHYGGKRKIEWNEDSEESISHIQEMLTQRKEAKRAKKLELKKARHAMQEIQQEAGPKVKIEYSYEPGELVRITAKAEKLYGSYLEHNNLFVGAMGIIVEQEDRHSYRGNENGRYIQVMGPNGLQQWDVAWVSFVEEDED